MRTLSLLLCSTILAWANPQFDDKHLEIAMRQIGHQVLLHSGDSSSRVLPIERVGSSFRIPFESEFHFEPGELLGIVKDVVREQDLPQHFILEVESCQSAEVIYGFELSSDQGNEIVPCLERGQEKACYQIVLTFPNLSDAYSQEEESKSYWYYLMLLPLLTFPLFIFLRRKPQVKHLEYALGDFLFKPHSYQLWRGEELLELTSKESDLLQVLVEAEGKAVEREVILNKVWKDEGDYVGRTLDVFISRLRKKLSADVRVQILTLRGVGYKLIIEE